MPQVMPWASGSNEGLAAVNACRDALLRGEVVVLPTEAGYVAAAAVLDAEATFRPPPAFGDRPAAIAVPGSARAVVWPPTTSPLARRLMRRGWPGPLVVLIPFDDRLAIAARIPEAVCRSVAKDGNLAFASPYHPLVCRILDDLIIPLLLWEITDAEGGIAATPEAALAGAGEIASVSVDAGPTRFAEPATVIKIDGDQWTMRRQGAIPAAAVAQFAARMILFVCTGNTCRSPLAAALCKRRLADQIGCATAELPQRGFTVASAGLAAVRGEPAAAEALVVARELGADLTDHTSRPATPELLADADLIVGMTAGHLETIAGLVEPTGHVRRLCRTGDLSDPIGGDLSVYQSCAGSIWQNLEGLIDDIVRS